jgi:hypothetical protein
LARALWPLGAALVGTTLAGCALVTRAPEQPNVQPLLRVQSAAPPRAAQAAGPTAQQAYEFGKRALDGAQHELAEAWFEQAVRTDAGHVDAINGRFVAVVRRGHFDRALALGEIAQRRGLASPELEHNMLRLRERLSSTQPAAGAAGATAAAAMEVLALPSTHLQWRSHGPQVLELTTSAGPEVASARAAPVPDETAGAHPASAPAMARVEVSNASGIAGLARRQSEALRASGHDVQRITNHGRFDLPTSEVRFRGADYRAAAQAVAALLPTTATVVHDAGVGARRVDLRVVLGRDGAAAMR